MVALSVMTYNYILNKTKKGQEMELSEEEKLKIQEKVDKLKASKFKQQMLPAWRPVPSFGSTMIVFAVFGIIFLTLGVALYVMSDKI